jgi:hypothetical protein
MGAVSLPCVGQEKCDIEPDVEKLLNRFSATIAAKKTYRVSIESSYRIITSEHDTGDVRLGYSLLVDRPNRLALRSNKPRDGINYVNDSRQLLTTWNRAQEYSVQVSPATLEKTFSSSDPANPFVAWFLPAICGSNPMDRLLAGVDRVRELEPIAVGNVKCRQLQFRASGDEWVLAIDASDPPLARQLKSRWPRALKAKGGTTLQFNDWDFRPKIADDAFRIEQPAAGWKQITDVDAR